MNSRRIAIVQHGDYREALNILRRDEPDPYFGMKRSVRFIEDFVRDTEYCIISVDAPNYREQRPGGEIVGLHRPYFPKLSRYLWGYKVYRHVKTFRPTHLLMRTGGMLALPSLQWATGSQVNSLVVMAGYMNAVKQLDKWTTRLLVKILNHKSVYMVTNHRRPATLSTIRAGVNPAKVVAWDFDGLPSPQDKPVKELKLDAPLSLLFVGELKAGKGILDLLEAYRSIVNRCRSSQLIVCGDGQLRGEAENFCVQNRLESVKFVGKVPNEFVQVQMCNATLAFVLSRRNSSEGFPFVLTEALASRTPVITSDHPAITELLQDGEGICVVPSSNPAAIAEAILITVDNPDRYRRLSESTWAAHAKISSDISFECLLTKWRASW